LQRAKTEFEAEVNKIRQTSAETVVDLNTTPVRIDDLKDEVNHVRQLVTPLATNAIMSYTLSNKCYHELVKTFSSIGASSREKNFWMVT
jgi:hypothetical protein